MKRDTTAATPGTSTNLRLALALALCGILIAVAGILMQIPTRSDRQPLRPSSSEAAPEPVATAAPTTDTAAPPPSANGSPGTSSAISPTPPAVPSAPAPSLHDQAAVGVQRGLKWLADHQDPRGYWDADAFDAQGRANGRVNGSYGNNVADPAWTGDTGFPEMDVAVTALATLAFLGAGYTHQNNPYADTVFRAIRYLISQQSSNDGGIGFEATRGSNTFMYGHALATQALWEAYIFTNVLALHGYAQHGLYYLYESQQKDEERGLLGWRYGPDPVVSDTAVSSVVGMALYAGSLAGEWIPYNTAMGLLELLAINIEPIDTAGTTAGSLHGGQNVRPTDYRTRYQQGFIPQSRLRGFERVFAENGTLDALHIVMKLLLNQHTATSLSVAQQRAGVVVRSLQRNIIRHPPTYDPADRMGSLAERDFFYWHVASLAMFQMGETASLDWVDHAARSLLAAQRTDPAEDATHATYGSWDTDSAWGQAGGRVYTTAINVLTLQTRYRYQRVQ